MQARGPCSNGRHAPGMGKSSSPSFASQRSGRKSLARGQYAGSCWQACETSQISISGVAGYDRPLRGSVIVKPGSPRRVVEAAGKRRMLSLMVAMVKGSLLRRCGSWVIAFAAFEGLGPRTALCSLRRRESMRGWMESR